MRRAAAALGESGSDRMQMPDRTTKTSTASQNSSTAGRRNGYRHRARSTPVRSLTPAGPSPRPIASYESGDEWPCDKLKSSHRARGGTEQGPRHDPREISHAEPERPDNHGNEPDMRQVGADFEMIVPEGESCRATDIFHREGNDDADCGQRQRIFPAIEEHRMTAGGQYARGRQTLRQWGGIPGKADDQSEVGHERDPESRIQRQTEFIANSLCGL